MLSTALIEKKLKDHGEGGILLGAKLDEHKKSSYS